MLVLFPNPVPPGSVSDARFDEVRELHATARRWAEPVPVHRPYIDLVFAFGLATLGDAAARRLLADAWEVMQHPVPPPVPGHRDYHPVTAALVPPLAYRGFEYRVDRALDGQPLAGSQSTGWVAELDNLQRESFDSGGAPRKLAAYVISRLREQSAIVDPDEQIDPYSSWTKHGDPARRELASLQAVHEPAELTPRLRRWCEAHLAGDLADPASASAVHDVLALAPRAEGEFAAELVGRIIPAFAVLRGETDGQGQEYAVRQQSRILERAMAVAAHDRRPDLASGLAGLLADLAERFPFDSRFRLVGGVGGPCVRALRDLGLREEIDRLARRLRPAVGNTPADPHHPEAIGHFLRSRLALAAASLALGSAPEADPLLDEARAALLAAGGPRLLPADYTEVARAYVAAAGEGSPEAGLPRLGDLLREMPPRRITNTWTTAPYFSRLHLNLSEQVVAATCRMLLARPLPG